MKSFFLSVITIFMLALPAFAKDITIVYTNSLNGYFDDCRCHEEPKGGLVTRATEMNTIRKEFKNVFLFETGDFFPCESDKLLSKYLVKGYEYIKYDMLTFGDQEFASGPEEFLKYKNSLPFVCNNISVSINNKWETPFKRYQILEKNGIKAAVIGTISSDAFKYYPKAITSKIQLWDQETEINKDLAEIKSKGPDIVILLSHSGVDADRELAQKIKGIDMIVGGHTQSLLKSPERIGNTTIVQAGVNGANIGILQLTLDKGKTKIVKNSFRLPHIPVTKEDAEIRRLITEYQKVAAEEYKNIKFK